MSNFLCRERPPWRSAAREESRLFPVSAGCHAHACVGMTALTHGDAGRHAHACVGMSAPTHGDASVAMAPARGESRLFPASGTPQRAFPTVIGLLCVLIACLVAAGCEEELNPIYGQRDGLGSGSVNGTAVWAEMFEKAGHSVISMRWLSPRLRKRADAIVWVPDDFDPPSDEVRQWLEQWLKEGTGRTLIYVGRDFDAAPWYWAKVAPKAPAALQAEITWRRQSAQSIYDVKRTANAPVKSCPWFTIDRSNTTHSARALEGDARWTGPIVASKLDIPLHGRIVPAAGAEVLLKSKNDVLISSRPEGSGRLIVVVNGSLVLNGPLVNHEHRKLAGMLVGEIGPPRKTVVFLENGAGGPQILNKDPHLAPTGPMEIFHVWPANWILLHLLVLGVLFCFCRYPLFGRPREPAPEATSDFGKHIDALATLLAKTGDLAYASARVALYQQMKERGKESPQTGNKSPTPE